MVIAAGEEYRVEVAADIGAAMRHFRTQQGLTQTATAEMEGVRQPYLSSLERGKFGSSVGHALRLLRLLGCEVVVRRTAPHA
jgi:transcriptional regulator with XRE-family HTH domain